MFNRKDQSMSLTQSEKNMNQSSCTFTEDNQSSDSENSAVIKSKNQSDDNDSPVKQEKPGSIMSFFSQQSNDKIKKDNVEAPKSMDRKESVENKGQSSNSSDNSLKSFFKRKQLENIGNTQEKNKTIENSIPTPSTSKDMPSKSFFGQKMETLNVSMKTGCDAGINLKDATPKSTVKSTDVEIEVLSDFDDEFGNPRMEGGKESDSDHNGPKTNLAKTNDVVNESDYSIEDYMQCEKCDKMIIVWEMPEHMDFHFAMDLQKDMNTESRNSAANQVKRKSTGTPGNERNSKKVKLGGSQGKLDIFFTKHT
jgi:hypothetical protein